MKSNTLFTILSISLITLLSCGEDRTHEYLEQTKENQWIYTTMQNVYLWKNDIKELKHSQYFTPSSKFFSSLLNKNDKASFFTEGTTSNYGMEFSLMRDPIAEKPSQVYALVLYVEPNSPADIAGIKRGMWISAINNKKLTTSSEKALQQGDVAKLAMEYIEFDNEANKYFWVSNDTIEISPAAPYETSGICIDNIYTERDKNIGYILCNNFNDEDFIEKANTIIERFLTQNVTNIIIDLRYNTGGNIGNVTSFASMLVPSNLTGTPFCTLKDNNENILATYNYTEQQFNIGDRKIYFIIGKKTKGTAELLVSSVNASRGMYDVYIIGEASAGVNIITEEIVSPYGFTINPATAFAYSANGDKLSEEGMKTDFPFDELEQKNNIYPLGDKQEYLLYNTFYIIEYGTSATSHITN